MNILKQNSENALSIASVDSIITTVLPDILKEISKEKYQLNVSIQTQHTKQIYDLMQNHEIDIGFVSSEMRLQDVIVEPVFEQKFLIIRPSKNPTSRKQIHPTELDPAYEIFQSCGYEYLCWHDYWWSPSIKPHITIDSVTTLCHFLSDEKYWSVVQLSSLKSIIHTSSIQLYDIIDPPPPRVCYKITHKYPNIKNLDGINRFI